MKQRTLEINDPEEVLQKKCEQLADAIKESEKIVIYTGAGISTAASIPDYRGPNGVWTMLLKGQQPIAQDLSDAEPTATHMCITKLESEGHVSHVVSQNCDGLHLRSGFPRKKLSEVHGNMYIELCNSCKPPREYIRLFDVTEKTGVRRHATDRNCHSCKKPVRDTIVHFGEKGGVKSPYRWKEASKAAENCDLILCLGTSCCDDVMKRVMDRFGYTIPSYSRSMDPIFRHATPLKHHERKNVNKKILEVPANYARKRRTSSKKNIVQFGMKKMRTESTVFSASGDDTKMQLSGVISPLNGILKKECTAEVNFSNIKSRLHIPMQTISSNNLPCTISSPSHESMSFPLDLSTSGPLSGTLRLDQSRASINESRISQHELIGQCPKCATFRTIGSLCSCSPVPSLNLQTQGIPSLPLHYMSCLGLHIMEDPRLMQLRPLHPSLWPHPCIPQVFQPGNKIDYVLKDHCYLNKDQMQKLSPKSEQPAKKDNAPTSSLNSPGKRETHFEKRPSLNNASASRSRPTEAVLSTTDIPEQSPTAVVGQNMLLLTPQDSDTTCVPKVCHKRSKTSQDTVIDSEDNTDPTSTTKKPNLCRSLSVPGWFGKGLKIGKKKR
ncbi:NAD-dependent protein deacetylase sirtuin-7 [Mizuhopecten yessoensis]|uniref:protein acetyllysine N-acetyltransferase n=1 Tax=Mizuhopecten yessoensis TaxID=6573 RepID=A0A210QV18_MIZYE|nr:NAD-dependent protein deacetylase sirtuin-7 [Mizuhopecten yessoensis]